MLACILLLCTIVTTSYAACPGGCYGHGRCDVYNRCHCFGDWYGHDCSQRLCPNGKAWGLVSGLNVAHLMTECSSRGICDRSRGTCTCQSGFEGEACQKLACPDMCYQRGTCLTLSQYAENTLVALNHHDGAPYPYTSIWDANSIQGCLCDPSFSGHNCILRTCPSGDDPLTLSQTEEIQLITCLTEYPEQTVTLNFDSTPSTGSFILFFGTEYTRPLGYDAEPTSDGGASVKERLEALTSVNSVTVSKVTTSVSREWTLTFPTGNTNHNYVLPKWRIPEIQSFICAADAGSFSITYSNEAALTDISFNADTATITSRLEALENIGVVIVSFDSGVTACATAGNTVTITFSTMRDKNNVGNLPELVLDKTNGGSSGLTLGGLDNAFLDGTAKEVRQGIDTCRIEEVQEVLCTATSGMFSLSFHGETISNILFSSTTAELKEKIETITSILEVGVSYSNGTTACTEYGNKISVTFTTVTILGTLSDGDLNEITTDITNGASSPLAHTTTDNLVLAATFTEVKKGTVCEPLNQPFTQNPSIQMLSDVTSGGGSFQISFRGQTTANIPAESSSAQVEQYLEKLDTIGGVSVTFTGTEACNKPENVMRVNFTQNFGNVPTMSVDSSLLSVGSTMSVKTGGQTVQDIISYEGTKEDRVCSGRGTCDTQQGFGCTCYLGYTTSNGRGSIGTTAVSRGDCGSLLGTISDCPGEIPCSGHGACSATPTYKCDCAEGWTNGECSERTCPKGTSWFSYPSAANVAHVEETECSGAGSCDRTTGECSCSAPFTGAACELMSCGSTGGINECSGHGQCVDLHHMAGLIKENGELAGYEYGTDSNDPNTWDARKIRSCICDQGYTGHDCSLRECPRGDDPNTFDSVPELQVARCVGTGGSFKLIFREETTTAIAFNADTTTVQAALEALSSIGRVSITFDSSAVACSSAGVTISITFETDLGQLPSLKINKDLLQDNVGGSGADGSGAISIAVHGAVLGGITSVTGTRENAECSNHGYCDYDSGICKCDSQYTSSNGNGEIGDIPDCGFHYVQSNNAAAE